MHQTLGTLPLLALSVLALAASAGLGAEAHPDAAGAKVQTYDLRVYGRLSASESQAGGVRCIRIAAENAEKAGIVYSKLVSDFTSLPTVKAVPVAAGGTQLTALAFDGGRRLLPALRAKESRVDVYCFDTPAALEAFLAAPPAALAGAAAPAGRAYPLFIDLWDRRNMGFWYSLGFKGIAKDRTDDQDFDWMRPRQLNVNTVGEGVAGVALRCARDDLGYKTNRWYDVATYAYDAHPEAVNRGDPDMTYCPNYYGDVPLADNPILRAQVADLQQYLAPFTRDDHLMTITDAYGETAARTYTAYAGFSGRDEWSRRDFVHYLRDLRGLGLRELGERWYGDRARFKSWDEVEFPRERDFYGWEDGRSQDLAGTWRWRRLDRKTGDQEGVYAPGYDDSKWLAYRQPGTQYMAGGSKHAGWMRCSFAPDAALLKANAPVYLTVCPFNYAPYSDPSTVYLNGRKLADVTFGHGLEWAQIDVAALLQPGANVLALYTPKGHVGGPVFLTLKKAETAFPTRDPRLNARRFDVCEWVGDHAARAVALSVKRLRGIDPVRAVKLMAPHDIVDLVMPYMAEWGVYPHCTGQGAFFRPWLRRNGYLHGIMGSSEPSQSAGSVHDLRRIFFTFTFEGQGAHDYFYNLHDILINPEKLAWYEQNLPYLKLTGRFDLRKPDLAIAWSLRADRCGVDNGSVYQNDPGRGDLQQAHFSFVYCSEKDILSGRADDYRVMIDDNFTTLDPKEVEALQVWVARGGFLVLNQRSGRNTIETPEAWPIRRLTGCKPTIRPQTGTVTFEKDPSLLKAFAGRSFRNYGEALDWQKHNYFTDSVALDPEEPGVEVLARYDDGKPAVVVRPLGRGKVVVLGSAFYRKSSDLKGFWVGSPEQTAFYGALLRDLGLRPLVETAQETLWAERFIANSGSTEMLVLGNQSDTETLRGGAAVWDVGFPPRRVFDPATGAELPARIEGSRITIANLDLLPYEMRFYAVERTDWDAGRTVEHWLGRQRQLWRAVPPGEPPSRPDDSWPVFAYGDFMVKQFPDEASARKAMAPDHIPDDTWRTLPASDWASANLPRGRNLWAVYRQDIVLTPAWLKDLRGADLIRSGARSWWNNVREAAINGRTVMIGGQPAKSEAVLAALQPGLNRLALLSSAGGDGNGGFYGQLGLRRIPGASGEIIDLSRGWTVYPTDVDPQAADFPGKGAWGLARKTVRLPEAAANCTVWIEIDGSPSAVAVNGRLRYASNNYGARIQPRPLLVNVTPDVRFGADNEIAFGPSDWFDRFEPRDLSVAAVKLILVPKE